MFTEFSPFLAEGSPLFSAGFKPHIHRRSAIVLIANSAIELLHMQTGATYSDKRRHTTLNVQAMLAHRRNRIYAVAVHTPTGTVTGRFLNTYVRLQGMVAKHTNTTSHRWLHFNLGSPLHGRSVPCYGAVQECISLAILQQRSAEISCEHDCAHTSVALSFTSKSQTNYGLQVSW